MGIDNSMMKELVKEIQAETREIALMEVCGTHTMAIARSGIRELLPSNVRLLSGPGCPVCVTAQGDIDAVIDLAREPGIILVTFGDMIRVPGSRTSLQEIRSQGADVRIAYSPLDALKIARENPDREVVFLGIGFETTAPAVGITIETACRENLNNYSVLSLHKVVPPALEAICSAPDVKVDALICPGHVSLVIGLQPYQELVEKYHIPCVVTGFETLDILEGIMMILLQARKGVAEAQIQYGQVVKEEGNPVARQILARVFEPVDARWRGLGIIPGSGLRIQEDFSRYDAWRKFSIPEYEEMEIKGCACGEVLSGKISPHQCVLFGKACTPINPVGPCMVSQEGACAAYYRYKPVRGRD